ncbi:hypothetical protein H4582DRAFT_2012653 [Lactarius indigo]|nr:hypothetical protein H4582DRAFT_2012653 [Lactarius indigo]
MINNCHTIDLLAFDTHFCLWRNMITDVVIIIIISFTGYGHLSRALPLWITAGSIHNFLGLSHSRRANRSFSAVSSRMYLMAAGQYVTVSTGFCDCASRVKLTAQHDIHLGLTLGLAPVFWERVAQLRHHVAVQSPVISHVRLPLVFIHGLTLARLGRDRQFVHWTGWSHILGSQPLVFGSELSNVLDGYAQRDIIVDRTHWRTHVFRERVAQLRHRAPVLNHPIWHPDPDFTQAFSHDRYGQDIPFVNWTAGEPA